MTQHLPRRKVAPVYLRVVPLLVVVSFLLRVDVHHFAAATVAVAFTTTSNNNIVANHRNSRRQRTSHHHYLSVQQQQRLVVTLAVQRPPISSSTTTTSCLSYSLQPGQPTELPDSLSDAAIRAAEATKYYHDLVGGGGSVPVRCRIDIDTSLGDETYTMLKQSTEFMQQYVTALSFALVPQLLQQRQDELLAVIDAKNELRQIKAVAQNEPSPTATTNDTTKSPDRTIQEQEQREDELIELIANNGRTTSTSSSSTASVSSKDVIRIYFPDEGSAALARRDWTSAMTVPTDGIEFRSCNGIQLPSSSNTNMTVIAQLFFCPRASDSDAVERILAASEDDAMNRLSSSSSSSLLTVFVNPLLVDMGVTGFGYAGRRLRERLLDGLMGVYYLRTLPWGAMTRQYPSSYTIWQEDSDAVDGYKCIANCNNRLPSNPEVMDIYDAVMKNNGQPYDTTNSNSGGGFLDQLGDFVNGMMRL